MIDIKQIDGGSTLSDPSVKEKSPEKMYLDLMKRCLLNSIYSYAEYQSISMRTGVRPLLATILKKLRLELVRRVDPKLRAVGKDWPLSAHTMIGQKRLDSLQACVEQVIHDHVPGDLIETGVWRGGASIFMRAILMAHHITDRSVYVADSFQGLPKPTHEVDKMDAGNDFYKDAQLAVSLEQVQANFQAYNLLDDQVKFVKGWFCDTLPGLSVPSFAVIRLDGDLYESTMDGLVNLYPKLSPHGFLIVDDYSIPACKKAVQDYRQQHGIEEPIIEIDWTGVYWRKKNKF
jgi:O-methyltransferase